MPAVINLGDRPTVNGQIATAEVHLLHWSGDLYGQRLQVQLHHYLRTQEKFDGLEALQKQIKADCLRAEDLVLSV
jgi:riboflavin kinase/FMN adenylyltransferase